MNILICNVLVYIHIDYTINHSLSGPSNHRVSREGTSRLCGPSRRKRGEV